MGKKQHQKDKLYLTATEWKYEHGGYKGGRKETSEFKRLPFDSCSLSFQPFDNPLCTEEGVVFDLMSIVPFLKKYGISPVTGKKMTAKDLIRLNFHKNATGKYHCPVTFKIFNENTHIVAIKPTGNVFAFEAVQRLNIKTSYFHDLLTDEPFVRKDIITIQDPTNLDKFNISTFFHVKNNLKIDDDEAARKDPRYHLKSLNAETRDVLDELDRDYKPAEKKEESKVIPDKFNSAHYSSGRVAASFTSTAMVPETQHEAAVIDDTVLRYERVRKKGYVKVVTNFGPLNLELHCEMIPRTCENFINLCAKGYYRDTIFHRSIRNFVIQGGDPTGTGKGGESIWGKPFKDEFKPNLKHTGRGVLSMANTGPDTNKSQFFITFRSCNHLDSKHSVFGRVVGGLDTLDKMEAVETDKSDKPKEEIKIEEVVVFVNPYEEADLELQKERETDRQKTEELKEEERKKALKYNYNTKNPDTPKVYKSGVGKYINPSVVKRKVDDTSQAESTQKKSKVTSAKFGDFSSW